MLTDTAVSAATGPPPGATSPIVPVEPVTHSARTGRHENEQQDSSSRDERESHGEHGPQALTIGNRRVTFRVDPETEQPVIRVVDRTTGEVVRQLPPEEVRQIEEALRRVRGLLLDTYA
ncbi:MAG: flagellar protein FlaG [Planctomycetota bacterium]